jgi:hypothetical protein
MIFPELQIPNNYKNPSLKVMDSYGMIVEKEAELWSFGIWNTL